MENGNTVFKYKPFTEIFWLLGCCCCFFFVKIKKWECTWMLCIYKCICLHRKFAWIHWILPYAKRNVISTEFGQFQAVALWIEFFFFFESIEPATTFGIDLQNAKKKILFIENAFEVFENINHYCGWDECFNLKEKNYENK